MSKVSQSKKRCMGVVALITATTFAEFDPASIPDCLLWLTPEVGLEESEGRISGWKTGTSGDAVAVQERDDRRPEKRYETWPGHLTIGFGKNSCSEIENLPPVGDNFTVFWVGKKARGSGSTLFGNFNSKGKKGWKLMVSGPGKLQLHAYTQESKNAARYKESHKIGTVGDRYFIAALSVKGKNIRAYYGTKPDLLLKKELKNPIAAAEEPYALFGDPRGNFVRTNSPGEIAEVLYFNRALSDDELKEIWTYLLEKYPDASTKDGLKASSIEPNGTTAPAGNTLSLTFSAPMSVLPFEQMPPVYKANFQTDPLKGTWRADGKRLIFTADEGWTAGDLIAVKIPNGFKSKNGKPYNEFRTVFSFIVEEGVDLGKTEYREESMALVRNGTHRLPIQLVLPEKGGPFPVLFFVHGGGWGGGTAEYSNAPKEPHCDYLASRLGIASVGIAYRCKGSNGTFTEAMEDIATAVKWVTENAERFNLDMTRTAFSGGSAGAPLSALAAQRHNANAYVGYNGIFNFQEMPDSRFGGGDAYGQRNPSAKANSAFYNLASLPPQTLLVHGSADTTISPNQSMRFAEAINKAGGKARCVIYEGEPHSFFGSGDQMGKAVLYEVKELYKEVFDLKLASENNHRPSL